MNSPAAGNIRGWPRRMLYKPQIFGRMRLRHQRAVFTTGQAVPNPWRILVTGYADTKIKGAAAQPAEKNVFVGQFAAVLTFLFSE